MTDMQSMLLEKAKIAQHKSQGARFKTSMPRCANSSLPTQGGALAELMLRPLHTGQTNKTSLQASWQVKRGNRPTLHCGWARLQKLGQEELSNARNTRTGRHAVKPMCVRLRQRFSVEARPARPSTQRLCGLEASSQQT